jgi:hypothetical protein
MTADLKFLIHFFNDRRYLFKTITMADAAQTEDIGGAVVSGKGWFFERFTKDQLPYYLKRRRFVEHELFTGYEKEYGRLAGRIPVYFYLFPGMTRGKALEMARKRAEHGETVPKVCLLEMRELPDAGRVTFTLHDSFTAYRIQAMDSGIPCRPEERDRPVLPDHNKIFPLSMIGQIQAKYRELNPYYEVQIWDPQLLTRVQIEILEA